MMEDSVRVRMMESARKKRRYFAAKKSRHQEAMRDDSSRDERLDAACLVRVSSLRVSDSMAGRLNSNSDSEGHSAVDHSGVGVCGPGVDDGGDVVSGVGDHIIANFINIISL
jgi:hypothetical protein